MSVTFKFRRGPAVEWITDNPVLASGEPGLETDTGFFKIGDGVRAWNALPYSNGSGGTGVGPAGPAGPQGTSGASGESVTVTLVPEASWPPAPDANPLHLYFRVPNAGS